MEGGHERPRRVYLQVPRRGYDNVHASRQLRRERTHKVPCGVRPRRDRNSRRRGNPESNPNGAPSFDTDLTHASLHLLESGLHLRNLQDALLNCS